MLHARGPWPENTPFVELCVGSGAVFLWLLLEKKPVVSYAGGKAGYAEEILNIFGPCKPSRVLLCDAGPWGNTLAALRDTPSIIADEINRNSSGDAITTRRWAVEHIETSPAAHLLAISSTFGGFERGGFKGRHKQRPAVDGFIPNRRALARRVRDLTIPSYVEVVRGCATSIHPFRANVYIDPPYAGTTGYASTFTRDQVVATAMAWAAAGSRVVVSESSPIEQLVARGWTACQLTTRKGQTRRNTRTNSEFITFNGPY